MIDFKELKNKIQKTDFITTFGEVHTIKDQLLISKGPICKLGDVCLVGEKKTPYEVISLRGNDVYLMPFVTDKTIKYKDRVYISKLQYHLPKAQKMLGRILNGIGEFIDKKDEKIEREVFYELERQAPNSLEKDRIKDIVSTGVKSIDGLLTIGEGQRIGIFAGSGVGKSTLLSMIAKNSTAEVNVIALIGERGREVKEFIERDLGEEGLKRSVLVVATGEESALMRVRAAQFATSIAEELRDEGKKVLLMMDSVTRFARAIRTMDIATGEVEIAGKTPSMENAMQLLLERAGTNNKGSITGIYTVLVEGDDMQEPIADISRGILDGHIVLDRKLVDRRHFPAINALNSISRVMDDIATEEHLELAKEIKKNMAIYEEYEDVFMFGSYRPGQNKEVDFARIVHQQINEFLTQGKNETYRFDDILEMMRRILK